MVWLTHVKDDEVNPSLSRGKSEKVKEEAERDDERDDERSLSKELVRDMYSFLLPFSMTKHTYFWTKNKHIR